MQGLYNKSYSTIIGQAAKLCQTVVMRQTIISGKYTMLDHRNNYEPLPDYFTAVIHKRLMGAKVLSATVINSLGTPPGGFRVYVHCLKNRRNINPLGGGLAIIALNLHSTEIRFNVKGFETIIVDEYLLTGKNGQLDAKIMQLNGIDLQLGPSDSFPRFTSKPMMQPIKMPGHSYGFYIINDAKVAECEY